MGKETLILVVDDAEINLKIAEKIISREYSVECVSSGEDCLAYLMDHNPDLILLDLHMPELDGFEVMEKLNASANWKDIPVIFLTADSDHDSEIQGFELGKYVRIGASPRASIAFLKMAKATALIQGRTYVTPEDVKQVSHQVLRHRIGLNYLAVADNVPVEAVIDALVNSVKAP